MRHPQQEGGGVERKKSLLTAEYLNINKTKQKKNKKTNHMPHRISSHIGLAVRADNQHEKRASFFFF